MNKNSKGKWQKVEMRSTERSHEFQQGMLTTATKAPYLMNKFLYFRIYKTLGENVF